MREAVLQSFENLRANKLRSVLTMFGILWGMISIVILSATGEGFRQGNDKVLLELGRNIGIVWGGLKQSSPEFISEFPILYGNWQSSHIVRAVAASYGEMRSEHPQPGGRFLDDEDVRLRRRVAFIGTEVQRKLFGGVPPVGETIRIGGRPFEIIGVMEEKVQLSNYNRPDKYCVFIPWTTMSGLIDTQQVGIFVWQSVSPVLEAKAERQVREYLAARYRYDPSDERAANMFGSAKAQQITAGIVTGLRLVLTFIGVLTLAIGGVGIMNIMFVNVQERTREIGVRKALGATRRQVLLQFLLEGLVTTFAGGSVGIIVSYALVWALSPRPFLAELLDDTSRVTDIHLVLSPELVGICASILMVVGIISGLLPAVKASRLDPIEALRYE